MLCGDHVDSPARARRTASGLLRGGRGDVARGAGVGAASIGATAPGAAELERPAGDARRAAVAIERRAPGPPGHASAGILRRRPAGPAQQPAAVATSAGAPAARRLGTATRAGECQFGVEGGVHAPGGGSVQAHPRSARMTAPTTA